MDIVIFNTAFSRGLVLSTELTHALCKRHVDRRQVLVFSDAVIRNFLLAQRGIVSSFLFDLFFPKKLKGITSAFPWNITK